MRRRWARQRSKRHRVHGCDFTDYPLVWIAEDDHQELSADVSGSADERAVRSPEFFGLFRDDQRDAEGGGEDVAPNEKGAAGATPSSRPETSRSAALLDRHVVPLRRAGIELARAADLALGILEHLLPHLDVFVVARLTENAMDTKTFIIANIAPVQCLDCPSALI